MGLNDHQSEWKRFTKSFLFAWHGIIRTIKYERNFQIHLFISLIILISGSIISLSRTEWIILLFLIGGMLSLELMNTALERAVDLITKDYHPLAKAAKDAAAGAVFVYALLSVIIGLIIFIPKMI